MVISERNSGRKKEVRQDFLGKGLWEEERQSCQPDTEETDGQYGDTRETLKRSDIQHRVQVIEPNGRP